MFTVRLLKVASVTCYGMNCSLQYNNLRDESLDV